MFSLSSFALAFAQPPDHFSVMRVSVVVEEEVVVVVVVEVDM